MRFFIMGGTGFVGGFLIDHLLTQGHEVAALVRPGSSLRNSGQRLTLVEGDPLRSGPWQERLAQAGVVVNLVGVSIMNRWTQDMKQTILESRVLSTDRAVEGLGKGGGKVLVCANAVGYYGHRGDELLTEQSLPGEGFLAEVCVQWQERAERAGQYGHRVVVGRFAPVLGPGGGVLSRMLTPFRLGVGGKIASGLEWFPWIHIRDLARFVEYAAQTPDLSGPVNVCAPETVTNAAFTKTLARVLSRPALLTVPALAVRLAYGEAAQAILSSLRCVPRVLLESAFHFEFPTLEQALRDIVA